MEPGQSVYGTVSNSPSGAVADGQGQRSATRLPASSPPGRKRVWRFSGADGMMALMALGISFGLIAAAFLLLAPGAALLGVVAFWQGSLTLFWLTSLALSFGISLALLLALWIFCGFDGGKCLAVFTVLALCALVGFVAVYDWQPAIFTALVAHLTH